MPGKAETEGVVIIAPLEVQEAPSGTRTGLTSLQGALAILLPGNPKVVKFLYSADLSSKNIFVEAKTYLYVENVFVYFLLWVHVVILSDRFQVAKELSVSVRV